MKTENFQWFQLCFHLDETTWGENTAVQSDNDSSRSFQLGLSDVLQSGHLPTADDVFVLMSLIVLSTALGLHKCSN